MKLLRKECEGEIFDYGMLMSHLSYLKAPHRKITELLKKGEIVRIKKGLYVFGEEYRKNPVHLGQLANLVFGPSYVSKEYALYWYGMIPERVDLITSMTPKRNKEFETPLGTFCYTYINNERYTVGVDWKQLENNQHFFIASPEKAIVDTIAEFSSITKKEDMRIHLIENMRFDEEMLSHLDMARFEKIKLAYRRPVINLLYETLLEGI